MEINWIQVATGFFGGSFTTYLVTLFVQAGKLEIDSTHAKVSYFSTTSLVHFIHSFELEIQLINRSAYLRVINNLTVKFFDGEKTHELIFKDSNVPPAATIEGRKERLLSYSLLLPVEKFELPMLSLYHDEAYLEISYQARNKIIEFKINGSQIAQEQIFKPIAL